MDWPTDGSPASFADVVDPLYDALKFCYALRRKNRDKDVPYTGFPVGRDVGHVGLQPNEALTAKNLSCDWEDQGRHAAAVILGIAVQLGIEQGRRIVRQDLHATGGAIWLARWSIDNGKDEVMTMHEVIADLERV